MAQEYIKSLRKIIKVGNAHYLNIPLKFIKKNNLEKGDTMLIHGNIGGELRVTPVNKGE